MREQTCPGCGVVLECGVAATDSLFCDEACERSARDKAFGESRVWRRVAAPGAWRPATGEVLYGFYAGRSEKRGQFGTYSVVLVRGLDGKVRMVSGSGIVNLADAAGLSDGQAVRVTYLGHKSLGDERFFKVYELHVARPDDRDAPRAAAEEASDGSS